MKLPGRKIRGSGSTCKSNNTSHGKEGGAGSLDRMEKNCKMRRVEEEAMIVEETSMTMIISDRHHRLLLGSLFACDTTSRNQIIFFYCHKEIKRIYAHKVSVSRKETTIREGGKKLGEEIKTRIHPSLEVEGGKKRKRQGNGKRKRQRNWMTKRKGINKRYFFLILHKNETIITSAFSRFPWLFFG